MHTGFLVHVRASSQVMQKQPDAAAEHHAATKAAVLRLGASSLPRYPHGVIAVSQDAYRKPCRPSLRESLRIAYDSCGTKNDFKPL